MSRVIKFRAWDKESRQMVAADRLTFHEFTDVADHFAQDDKVFMQFTGLLDKNGKEIYEGDIVHYLYQPGEGFWNSDSLAQIAWDNTGFAMRPISGSGCMNGWLCSVPGAYMPACQKLFEVVGNAHQNPELLP
jgi:hypothetical protein